MVVLAHEKFVRSAFRNLTVFSLNWPMQFSGGRKAACAQKSYLVNHLLKLSSSRIRLTKSENDTEKEQRRDGSTNVEYGSSWQPLLVRLMRMFRKKRVAQKQPTPRMNCARRATSRRLTPILARSRDDEAPTLVAQQKTLRYLLQFVAQRGNTDYRRGLRVVLNMRPLVCY